MSLSCVMTIDDSEPDQFISKLVIEGYDSEIEVLQAYDGQEALEMLATAERMPEIIFLDINMPRMNGHEFLAAYHARNEPEVAVVVMLTSSSQEQDKEKSQAYDCVKKYIAKPLETQLMEAIASLVA